jgi:RNA polymerase sigma-70 factor (ECF subfamily)
MPISPWIANLIDQRSLFLAFVRRRVKDASTSEDILQIAYSRAVSQQQSLKTSASANAWFYRILRNAIVDHYRHSAVETRTLESLAPGMEAHAPTPDMTPSNTCPCMATALHELQPGYEAILRQVDLEEILLETYSRIAGITPQNAAVRAHRARRALRKKLQDHCGSCAESGCLDCTCRSKAAHHG